MENDILFKSKLFGGYKKEEVMAYIASLGAEKAALTAEVNSMRSQLASMGAKLRELDDVRLESEAQRLAFAQSVEKCHMLESDNASLNAELSAKQSESAVREAKIAELEENCKHLSGDCERLRAVETKLGAAMLDAHLYSDKLVAQAKEESVRIRSEVCESIGVTVGRIDGLTGSLGEISDSFNKALEEVSLRIRALTGDMSKAASSLRKAEASSESKPAPTAQEVTAALDSFANSDSFSAVTSGHEPSYESVAVKEDACGIASPSVQYDSEPAQSVESQVADSTAPASPASPDDGSGVEFITDDNDDGGNGGNGGNGEEPITSVYLYG